MVWNNTQSSLYKSPRRFYRQSTPDNAPPRNPHEHSQSPDNAPPRSPNEHAQSPDNAPPRSPHEHAQSPDNAPPRNLFRALSGITNDKDALLLIGLIFLLLHEKADTKLVLALAFVLLC